MCKRGKIGQEKRLKERNGTNVPKKRNRKVIKDGEKKAKEQKIEKGKLDHPLDLISD